MIVYGYVYLTVSGINDSNNTRGRKKELGNIVIIRYLYYHRMNGIRLFESRLTLAVNIYLIYISNSRKTTKK